MSLSENWNNSYYLLDFLHIIFLLPSTHFRWKMTYGLWWKISEKRWLMTLDRWEVKDERWGIADGRQLMKLWWISINLYQPPLTSSTSVNLIQPQPHSSNIILPLWTSPNFCHLIYTSMNLYQCLETSGNLSQ